MLFPQFFSLFWHQNHQESRQSPISDLYVATYLGIYSSQVVLFSSLVHIEGETNTYKMEHKFGVVITNYGFLELHEP